MNVEEIKRQIDSKKALIKKLENEIQELEKNLVNDTIRMYKKGKIRMYKNVHKINPKVHSFVIL